MEHREFGEEIPLEAQRWTWIKPENNPGKVRPAALNHDYDYVWEDFRSEQHKRKQEVWWPRPPPEYSVIQAEMLNVCFRYQENHWLFELGRK